ncbi:MAG: hypothetical protein H6841_00970 [Planctomycetes bacterium]|nr:hypothetical protein [Planctomycetota bacterium]MCB9935925.1 hypothetical protein [Planctomycetota bacterium]
MSLHDLLIASWTKLGVVAPDALAEARLQAHYAVQALAAAGSSLLKPTEDDSHTACEWYDRVQSLVGGEIPGGLRAALRLRDLRLLLLTKDGVELASTPLEGRTLQQGITWLAASLTEQSGALRPALKPPAYQLPEHPLAGEAAFQVPAASASELATWYANADRALQFVAAREPEALQVRCWPHHFDMATLLKLDPYQPREKARTIGVGMSPGDDAIRQPYFYLTPWPYPKTDNLPGLTGGGTWHRKGWTGAVLTGAKLVSADSAERQVETLTGFIDSALSACRGLLA